jgi:hypothetical protein
VPVASLPPLSIALCVTGASVYDVEGRILTDRCPPSAVMSFRFSIACRTAE